MKAIKSLVLAAVLVGSFASIAEAGKGRIITGVDRESCINTYGGKPMSGDRCMISYED